MSKTIELEKVNEIIDEEIHRIESVQLTDEHEDTICILLDIKQKLQPTPSDHFDRVYREEDLNEVFYPISVEEGYTSEWYKKTMTTNEKFLLNTLLKLGYVCSTEQGAERLLRAHQNEAKIQAFARELNRKSGFVPNLYSHKHRINVTVNLVELEYVLSGNVNTVTFSNIGVYFNDWDNYKKMKAFIEKYSQEDLKDIMYL